MKQHARPYERLLKGMKYTAGQAAKATGVATATITRALKSGKISGQKDDNGAWMIDPAELHRVFPPVSMKAREKPFMKHRETPYEIDESPLESSVLQREIQVLRETLADIREDRDKWRDMAERLSIAPPIATKVEHENVHSRWQFWRKK